MKKIKEKIIKTIVELQVKTAAISYGDTTTAKNLRENCADQILELFEQRKKEILEEMKKEKNGKI